MALHSGLGDFAAGHFIGAPRSIDAVLQNAIFSMIVATSALNQSSSSTDSVLSADDCRCFLQAVLTAEIS